MSDKNKETEAQVHFQMESGKRQSDRMGAWCMSDMTTPQPDSREAFEKWATCGEFLDKLLQIDFSRDLWHPDSYDNPTIQLMWVSWQAALSQPKEGAVPFNEQALVNMALEMYGSIDTEQMYRTIKAMRALNMSTESQKP